MANTPITLGHHFHIAGGSYTLRAVVAHRGYDPRSGHYACYIPASEAAVCFCVALCLSVCVLSMCPLDV